jgi:glutamate N-acetyltransferase/amino-acid N-acetyltransferase
LSLGFDSRWIEWPDQVRLDEAGLPKGFRAAACAAGIKPSGKVDLALLVSDEEGTTSALRQTRSSAAAAPVLVNREQVDPGRIRCAVVNSGNANAATGEAGYEDALRMQAAAASATGVSVDSVSVYSTGVIGQRLDVSLIEDALPGLGADLSGSAHEAFSEAILTTDAGPKRLTAEIQLPSGPVRIAAQAKGAGMMRPAFATMLCYVETDAGMSSDTCDLLLGTCVKRSFERISVDGQMSTNDAVLLMASGASRVVVEPQTEDEAVFGVALDVILRALALMIVSDGEGAARVGRVVVEGGEDQTVEHVARTIAGSPLVKAALHGGDPNWGRIVQAVGMALPDSSRLPVDIVIEGVQVCSAGAAVPFDEEALAEAVAGSEVDYTVRIPGSGSACEVFFSDLSHEYVTINSEYTT